MMADVPKEIKEFDELAKRAERIANATELAHSEAYNVAAKKLLMNEEGDELDLDKLEDSKMQEKMADEMSQFYLKKAKKYFKSGTDEGDRLKADGLMREYAGITKAELHKSIRGHGKQYSLSMHERYRSNLMDEIRKKLTSSAAGNLTQDHTGHLIKHLGIEDIVDAKKMKIDEAIQLHHMYQQNKGLTKEQIKNIYKQQGAGSPIYLKD